MPTVPTPTINEGPPNDAPPLAAPQHGVFVRDRRRPGRVATANPSLVALTRGTAPAEPPATGAPGGRGHLLLWVIAGLGRRLGRPGRAAVRLNPPGSVAPAAEPPGHGWRCRPVPPGRLARPLAS